MVLALRNNSGIANYSKIPTSRPRQGEIKYIASYNILAVNNDPLEDFSKRFFFGHENSQL